MDPTPAQAPPLVTAFAPMRKESMVSPEDMPFHGSQQATQSYYPSQEDDAIDEDNEQDFGNEMANMDLEDNSYSKPQLGGRGPTMTGDPPKGSQKNFVFKLFQYVFAR